MSVKKLFPEKRLSKRIIGFFEKRGFYYTLIIVLCFAIVGGTAVFLSRYRVDSPEDQGDLGYLAEGSETDYDFEFNPGEEEIPLDYFTRNAESIEEGEEAAEWDSGEEVASEFLEKEVSEGDLNAEPADKAEASQENTAGADKAVAAAKPQEAKKDSGAKKTTPPEKMELAMPVFGEMTLEFAMDKLVYSKTLDEWRTHSGVDIAADRGTPVKAAADGVVLETIDDPRYGVTVIIDHQNGYKTVYANLAEGVLVSPNQKVKKGEAIGSVGNTASIECLEPPHLHFEVLKENLPVDPTLHLAGQKTG